MHIVPDLKLLLKSIDHLNFLFLSLILFLVNFWDILCLTDDKMNKSRFNSICIIYSTFIEKL